MSQPHERMFYELMWRIHGTGRHAPLPWWVQQNFRQWSDDYDQGLFLSKEAAFASNALYRYWNMVGVKDHHQESLVGQAGEVEPVYDKYALSFCLFDPAERTFHYPQFPAVIGGRSGLTQELEDGYLPIIVTTYRSPMGITILQKVLATTVGHDQRSAVLVRLKVSLEAGSPAVAAMLCIIVSPTGPTGFQRHDHAGRYQDDRRLTLLSYISGEHRVEVNQSWGPLFDAPPDHFGTYGNGSSQDPDHYVKHNPYADLIQYGVMNGYSVAVDRIAGLCHGCFGWNLSLSQANGAFTLDIRLPVDDYRGPADLKELRAADADDMERDNKQYWENKLNSSGLQFSFPPAIKHLTDLYRTCRANLLILSDHGEIHPGPTIYDSFWVRDSSIEGIACALAGDENLAEEQFATHYPTVFNHSGSSGDVSFRGFFGGEHERNDREWDSNGQALWAFGRFDRIRGRSYRFGDGLFQPYVLDGARWIRDNRDQYGLLHSGWSAEHIGGKDQPHYWDDFWALAGLWEAAKLAERIMAPEAQEIWHIYDDLKGATVNSINYVLDLQRKKGRWETFIPTGPGNVDLLDSTIVGTVAYFHPCRLYMGTKLGPEVDFAARMTLETIWSHFIDGGFRHDSAWRCYGPYLTLQLAHAFLLIGDLQRMDHCLLWASHAGYATVRRDGGSIDNIWQIVQGAWNEQHCYPVAKDFFEKPYTSWYMGDIPHGWACAELMLLLRDIAFFEADEDHDPHIYLAPGVLPRWLDDGQDLTVSHAPTIFGHNFGFSISHDKPAKKVDISISENVPGVRFVYPCRFGNGVISAVADGRAVPFHGHDVYLPPEMRNASIVYA